MRPCLGCCRSGTRSIAAKSLDRAVSPANFDIARVGDGNRQNWRGAGGRRIRIFSSADAVSSVRTLFRRFGALSQQRTRSTAFWRALLLAGFCETPPATETDRKYRATSGDRETRVVGWDDVNLRAG
jgi:hypothetical protein